MYNNTNNIIIIIIHNNNNNNNNDDDNNNNNNNFLTAPRTVSNTHAQVAGRNRVQITCKTSSAYHVQHVVLRATWYEGTAQLLSLTEFKSHLPMKEGRKAEYPEKTPGDELQKMPHTKARRFKSKTRLEISQQHW